jgi:hypothetical protein
MKPLHLLFVLLLAISFASCTKGEDLEKTSRLKMFFLKKQK